MSQPAAETTADGARDNRDDARLARLEQLINDLSARLRAVERQLDDTTQPARHTQARPFGQGTPPRADTTTTDAIKPTGAHASADAVTNEGATVEARRGDVASEPVSNVASEPVGDVTSEPVEDYPSTVPPTRAAETEGEESERESPFPGPAFGAADARERAEAFDVRSSARDRKRTDDVDASGASAVARARRDVESIIGGSLFNWVGILAVTLAVGFFLKLAFQREWIGPAARVLLGGAAGCGVLALAEFLRTRGYRAYAHVLTGGGILILYLSVYAARGLYELVGVTVAFALMSVVTATAVALSVRHDSRAIAVLGLIGGFMTPALLSTGVDRQIALFTYIAFLDAGVLALAYFKRWRVLDHLAFVATVFTFIGWYAAYFAEWKMARTFFFLTLFFLMFSALAVLHNVMRRRRARWLDLSLVIWNATLYFAASYGLLETRYANALGALAFAVAVFYALLSYVAYTYHREDRLLASAYVGAAATLLAVAVAVQFHQHWITIGWAAEGLALTWLGLRTRERAPRLFALVVFAFAGLRWLTIDLFAVEISADTRFVPLLNSRAFSCLVIVAALACAAWLYRRAAAQLSEVERDRILAASTLACCALVLVLLTTDAHDYFTQQLMRLPEEVRYEMRARSLNTEQLTLSLVWTIYAVALISVGLARRLKFLRFAGIALLALTATKILFVDGGYYDAAWHAPLFNQTFAAFAVFVAAVAYLARLYARADGVDKEERRMATAALAVVGNLFAVAALSLEASGYFRKQLAARAAAGENARDLRLAQQLSLSLVWAVYGGAMLAFGHVRQNKLLRLMALALLAATTFKVFLFDLAELDQVYRIVSFVVLGLVLLGVSFLYQQRLRRAKEGEEGSMKSER